MRYENDSSMLIILPNQDDLDELRIQLQKEDYSKLLYLIQFKGLTDTNSYESFVFFEKDGSTMLLKEYDNPEHCSYNKSIDKSSLNSFINVVKQYEYETDYESLINCFLYKKELDDFLDDDKKTISKKSKI